MIIDYSNLYYVLIKEKIMMKINDNKYLINNLEMLCILSEEELEKVSGGVQIRNVQSGLCLDVAEDRPGGNVVVAACGPASQRPYQNWSL